MSRPLVSLLVLVLAAVAWTQDAFDYRIANIQILQVKAVQRELKITSAQRAAMNRAANANRAKVQVELDRARASGGKPNEQALSTLYMQLRGEVIAQLSQAQLRRLREITIQAAGAAGIVDPVVSERLGLSHSQVSTAKSAYQAGVNRATELRKRTYEPILKPHRAHPPKNAEEAKKLHALLDPQILRAEKRILPQLMRLKNSTEKAVLAVLTPGQLALWKELNGKPYTAR